MSDRERIRDLKRDGDRLIEKRNEKRTSESYRVRGVERKRDQKRDGVRDRKKGKVSILKGGSGEMRRGKREKERGIRVSERKRDIRVSERKREKERRKQ